MTKVREMLEGALRLIGVQDASEPMNAGQASSALAVLNEMVEAWNLEPLMIYSEQVTEWALTPGKRDYTMGPTGADFISTRPVNINRANLKIGALETPLALVDDQEWDRVQLKTLGGRPVALHDHGDFPNTTLSLWPVPSGGQSVVIYSEAQIATFATINDTVSLPPGYRKAIRTNLALELCAEYQIQPSPALIKLAQESRAAVKRNNSKPPLMRSDRAVNGGGRFADIASFLGGE